MTYREIQEMTQSNPSETAATAKGPRDEFAEAAETVSTRAREAASGAVESAVREAHTQTEAAKAGVVDEVSDIASALRVAAGEMRNGSVQERVFAQMADSLADASEAIQHKDLSGIMDDATAFARRNPLIFLSGAALLGFAATRFAKASDGRAAAGEYPASGHRAATGGAGPAPSAPPGGLGDRAVPGAGL
jgi:hypothetical protein